MLGMRASEVEKAPIATARLRLKDGWRATVVLRDEEGNSLSQADWQEFLGEPEELLAEKGRSLKAEGANWVAARTIRIGGRELEAVVKLQKRGAGIRDFFRRMRHSRSMRTLKTALKLQAMGISAEYPLAAIEQRKWLWATQGVYISVYVKDSRPLYYFLRDDLDGADGGAVVCRRSTARRIAEIFAGLHNGGLWHRDAKGGNFLVQRENGSCKVVLVDLDGIKPYTVRRRSCRFRSLVKLAATVLCHRGIHMSDYWRTFTIYCELTGIREQERRNLFLELAQEAAAMRLLTMTTSAIEGRGTFVDPT